MTVYIKRSAGKRICCINRYPIWKHASFIAKIYFTGKAPGHKIWHKVRVVCYAERCTCPFCLWFWNNSFFIELLPVYRDIDSNLLLFLHVAKQCLRVLICQLIVFSLNTCQEFSDGMFYELISKPSLLTSINCNQSTDKLLYPLDNNLIK